MIRTLKKIQEQWFQTIQKNLSQPIKIADDIFIESHLNTKSKIAVIKTILRKFGFDEFEIKIYLKEKSEQKEKKKTEPTLFDVNE